MKFLPTILTLALMMCLNIKPLSAQKIFSEGIIKYDVFQGEETKPSGIYLITVKGGNIRRELAMQSGFSNVTIFHSKTGNSYTLNLDDNTKYALELKPAEVKLKNKKFENAVITQGNQTKKLSGYQTQSAKVEYQDKDVVTIYYTKDLVPQSEFFNTQFPGLDGIPLEYEVKGGLKMKFVATLVDIKVVESKIFEIPSDYKIVSKVELEKLK